jgi:signal transduction histidine kinase
LAVEDPGPQFWQRAALVVPVAAACALGVAVLTAMGLHELPTVHASLRLCWCIVVLAAGVALLLRWRMTGEAPVALLGAALVVWSLPQLPFALGDIAGDPEAAWRRLGPLTRMTVMVPAGWLLLRCVRSPEVDSSLHPWREALGYSLAATAAAATLTTGQAVGLVAHSSPAARLVTGAMLAAALFAFALLFGFRARSIPPPLNGRLAAAFAGLGLGALVHVGGQAAARPLSVLAETVAVMAATLLALIALTLLRSALDFYGLRLLSLRMEAEVAEDAVRREQERIHEVRATVAGIRQASGALDRYAHRLDPVREQDLRLMMAAELSRLERLLTADWEIGEPDVVALDDVISRVLMSQGEQGAVVRWRRAPTPTYALTDADAVAEVLHILVSNARVHAPGATVDIAVERDAHRVRIMVADDGPGIPAGVGARVFERGARGKGSPGSGLGLHIARQLARTCSGDLELLPAEHPHATRFVLTLRAAPDAVEDRSASPLERPA